LYYYSPKVIEDEEYFIRDRESFEKLMKELKEKYGIIRKGPQE